MAEPRLHNSKKLNKNIIEEQIKQLPEISKKGGWVYSYDEELDQLYFSPNEIPDGNNLISLNNEVSFFIDKESNINGIFIEYFRTNFLEHTNKLEAIKEVLDKKEKIVKKNFKKKDEKEVEILNKIIINDLLQELEEKKVEKKLIFISA